MVKAVSVMLLVFVPLIIGVVMNPVLDTLFKIFQKRTADDQ